MKLKAGASVLGVVIVLIFLLWVGSTIPFMVRHFYGIRGTEAAELGTIGDMFGAANACFSSAALLAVLYGLYMQRREMLDQRAEFKKQTQIQQKMEATHRAALVAEVLLPMAAQLVEEPYSGAFAKLRAFGVNHRQQDLTMIFEQQARSKLDFTERHGRAKQPVRIYLTSSSHDLVIAYKVVSSFAERLSRLIESEVGVTDASLRLVLPAEAVAVLVRVVLPIETYLKGAFERRDPDYLSRFVDLYSHDRLEQLLPFLPEPE